MVENKISKSRLLIENFLVYGLGGIISKIIPLIMLPIVTRLLPDTSYFGISDLSNTAVQFGSAVAVIGMYDAMYRMFFEKDNEEFKKRVCSTVFCFTILMSVIVTVIMIVFRKFISKYFFGDMKYSYLVYVTAITTLVSATNSIIAAPTRMQNKRNIFLVLNTISPILSYAISIPLIVRGYYIIALPLAALITGATVEVSFGIMNRKWFHNKLFDKELLKSLLIIAVPLFPNFLIYWIFNSSDKLMIANLIDIGATGIYSVGSKFGHCSQLIYTAFAGGWQYFAFSTMKEENQVKLNSNIFEYLGIISFITSVFVFSLSNVIFRILFTGKYIDGYIVAPYLFLAPLLQMLYQIISNQFLVIKKTWPNVFILFSGAIINVILNLLLIPIIGIEGAAIATLTGYICSDIICCIVLYKMKLMVISSRFLLAATITAAYILTWRLLFIDHFAISFVVSCVIAAVLLYLYKAEVLLIIKRLKR